MINYRKCLIIGIYATYQICFLGIDKGTIYINNLIFFFAYKGIIIINSLFLAHKIPIL
ncbi:hypothetical protein C2G38_2066309, partial [Gigaspora rosea]